MIFSDFFMIFGVFLIFHDFSPSRAQKYEKPMFSYRFSWFFMVLRVPQGCQCYMNLDESEMNLGVIWMDLDESG